MKRLLFGIVFALWSAGPAMAGVSCSLPFTLTNGTLADATQVMANYTALVNCLANAAAAGSNSDITSLTGLTSPISPGVAGGSSVYIASVFPTASGSNISIPTLLPSGFTNTRGNSVYFQSPVTNTGPITASVNGLISLPVGKPGVPGPVPLTGNELVTGNLAYMAFDGVQYVLFTTQGFVSSSATNQSISGGANITSANLGTFNAGNTLAVNCGRGPLQVFSNNGNMTVSAPTLDGSCVLLDGNAGGAGSITFSGFTTNTNTGEALDTVNTHQFMISIVRINGISTYMIKALQ